MTVGACAAPPAEAKSDCVAASGPWTWGLSLDWKGSGCPEYRSCDATAEGYRFERNGHEDGEQACNDWGKGGIKGTAMHLHQPTLCLEAVVITMQLITLPPRRAVGETLQIAPIQKNASLERVGKLWPALGERLCERRIEAERHKLRGRDA